MAKSVRGNLLLFPQELKTFHGQQNLSQIPPHRSEEKYERYSPLVASQAPHAQAGTSRFIYNYFYGLNLEEEDENASSPYTSEREDEFIPEQKKEQKKLSNCMTYIFLLKAYVAVGILTITVGFRQAGDLLASVFLIFAGILSIIGAKQLIQARQIIPSSFSGIAEMSYGRWLKIIVDILIVVSQTGFVTGFIAFVSLHVNVIAKWWLGELDNPNRIVSKWWVALFCFILWSLLCWVRRIEVFGKCHVFANICIIVGITLILTQSFVQIGEGHLGTSSNVIYGDDWFALLGFMGNSVYMFEGIGVIIPIYDSMKKKQDFVKVLTLLIINLVSIFLIFGFATQMAFTSTILPSHSFITQTLNYNYNRWYNYLVQLAWLLSLIPSFPLCLYPAIRILQKCLFGNYKGSVTKRKWMKNCFRTFWSGFAILIATVFEQAISKILGITGAIACTPIAFTIPALFHLKLVAKTPAERGCDWFLIILSLLILVFATTFNILAVIRQL